MEGDVCGLCGGDGRIGNALGRSSATCPSCHGSGRRADTSARFRDVTKTKPSHHEKPSGQGGSNGLNKPTGPKAPTSLEGGNLAAEISASSLAADAKARLIAEVVNHETTHEGHCTQTFLKKLRKQVKAG